MEQTYQTCKGAGFIGFRVGSETYPLRDVKRRFEPEQQWMVAFDIIASRGTVAVWGFGESFFALSGRPKISSQSVWDVRCSSSDRGYRVGRR